MPAWAATARRWSRGTPSCTGSRASASPRCGCSSVPCRQSPKRSSPEPVAIEKTPIVGPALADARTACEEHRWGDAWRLRAAVGGDLDIDDLDRFATAAYLTGNDEDAFRLWEEAHRRCLADNSVHRAAH